MGFFTNMVNGDGPLVNAMQNSDSGFISGLGNILDDGVVGAVATGMQNSDSGFISGLGNAIGWVDDTVDGVVEGARETVSGVISGAAGAIVNYVAPKPPSGGTSSGTSGGTVAGPNGMICTLPAPLPPDTEAQCRANDAAILLAIKELGMQHQQQVKQMMSKMCLKPKSASCGRPAPAYKYKTSCGCR